MKSGLDDGIKKSVIVVGGGVAGMSSAVACAEAGYSVTLLEATAHLGGRARSFFDRDTGEVIDNGQHLMMGCYHSFLRLLRTLGTEHYLKEQTALRVVFYSNNGTRDELTSPLQGQIGVALGILRMSSLSWLDKLQILRFATAVLLRRTNHQGLTCSELLHKFKQTPNAINVLWEPIILATLNAHPDSADAGLLVEVLTRAFFGGGNSSSLLLPTVGLSELFAPFTQWLNTRDGEVHTSTPVESLIINRDEVVGVRLRSGQEYYAERIILAVQPHALSRLISASEFTQDSQRGIVSDSILNQLSIYRPSPICSLYLWFDREFMDEDFCAMLDTTTQWVFNKRNINKSDNATQETSNSFLVSLTVSAANPLLETAPEEVAAICAEELRRAFPKASNAILHHWKVIKEKTATFLATPEVQKNRCSNKTAIRGLYFAGDWTDTGLPATLEGSAQSGFKAGVLATTE
jgi:hydroxysqualene dehydroxylase